MPLGLKMDFRESGNTKKKILKISKKIQTKISKCQEPKRECDLAYYNKKPDTHTHLHRPGPPGRLLGRSRTCKKTHSINCSASITFLEFKFTALFLQNKFSYKHLWYFIFRLFRKMGVPKFYRYMSERYPCLSQVSHDLQCVSTIMEPEIILLLFRL